MDADDAASSLLLLLNDGMWDPASPRSSMASTCCPGAPEAGVEEETDEDDMCDRMPAPVTPPALLVRHSLEGYRDDTRQNPYLQHLFGVCGNVDGRQGGADAAMHADEVQRRTEKERVRRAVHFARPSCRAGTPPPPQPPPTHRAAGLVGDKKKGWGGPWEHTSSTITGRQESPPTPATGLRRTTATRRSGRHVCARGGHRGYMANDRVLRPGPARRGRKKNIEARRVEQSGLMRHRPGPSRGHGQKMLGEEPIQRGGAQMATCIMGPRAPRKGVPRLGLHGVARRAGRGAVADREVPRGLDTDKFDVRPGCGRWQGGRCGDQWRTGQQQVSSSKQRSDLTATAWAASPQLYRRLPAILAGGQMPGATAREQW
jgi:hypothetical protein